MPWLLPHSILSSAPPPPSHSPISHQLQILTSYFPCLLIITPIILTIPLWCFHQPTLLPPPHLTPPLYFPLGVDPGKSHQQGGKQLGFGNYFWKLQKAITQTEFDLRLTEMKLGGYNDAAVYLTDTTKLQPSLWVRGHILEGAINAHWMPVCTFIFYIRRFDQNIPLLLYPILHYAIFNKLLWFLKLLSLNVQVCCKSMAWNLKFSSICIPSIIYHEHTMFR